MVRHADEPFQVLLSGHRAAADRNGERSTFNTEFPLVLPDLPNQLFCFLRTDPRQEHGEFIAAGSEDERFLGKCKAQEFSAGPDIFIPGNMTVGIVDLFQMVAVRDDDAQRIRAESLQFCQILCIIAAVVNPGQLVGDISFPEFPAHLLLLRHDIDQGNDAPNPAVLIEQGLLDDLQEFLFPLILLNDIGAAVPGPDYFQVGFKCPPGVFLVFADVQVRFPADGPFRIVFRVQVMPHLGRKDVTAVIVLQINIGRATGASGKTP